MKKTPKKQKKKGQGGGKHLITTLLQGAELMLPPFVYVKGFLNPVPTLKRFFLLASFIRNTQSLPGFNHPAAYTEKGQLGLSCSLTREEEATFKPWPL